MKTATLLELVEDIRHEIGAAPGFSQGVSTLPSLKYLCRRTQEQLYNAFSWPHLTVELDEPLLAGERYYSFNDGLNRDRILGTWVKWSTLWSPVPFGFDTTQYNSSVEEDTYRSDPVVGWRFYQGTQYEVWPTPASTQTLRWRYIRNLNPLVADADVCDVDATLIVLFAASELLTRLKSADAQAKNSLAQAHFARLKAQMMPTRTVVYGGKSGQLPHDYKLRGGRL